MKKKEIATALGLSVVLSMTTGCASQSDVDAMQAQITELTAQMESLQTELTDVQNESADATSKNAELGSQVAELQGQLENTESELEYAEGVIKSADDDTENATINITKYSFAATTVYSKAEENDEFKIMDLEMNTECFVVSIFSDANNNNWAGLGALKTTAENGNVTYQIISSAEKCEKKIKNKNVDFFFKKTSSIIVAPLEKGASPVEINMQDLEENQEVVMIYCRSSLLSNEKVKEESKTSTQVQKEKKDTQKQQTQPSTGNTGSDTNGGWPEGWECHCNTVGCVGASGTVWH